MYVGSFVNVRAADNLVIFNDDLQHVAKPAKYADLHITHAVAVGGVLACEVLFVVNLKNVCPEVSRPRSM